MLTLIQFPIVFVLTFVAGVWILAQVLPDRQGPPGWLVIAVLVSVSAFTAYAVIVERPSSDCVEYTPQGSGSC